MPHRSRKGNAKQRILMRLAEMDDGLDFGLMEKVVAVIKEEL